MHVSCSSSVCDEKWGETGVGLENVQSFVFNILQETGRPPRWRGLPITWGQLDWSTRAAWRLYFSRDLGTGELLLFSSGVAHRDCWTAPKAKRRGPQIAPRAPQKALTLSLRRFRSMCVYISPGRMLQIRELWLPCVQWKPASSVFLRILTAGRKCFSSDCTVIIPQQTREYHNSILGSPASANFPPAKPVRAKQNPTTQCIIPGSWGSLPAWHATLLTGGSSASEHMPLFYGDHERH